MADLVDRFGERMLGAPKNRGLGRLAWLGPIIVLVIGLAMIGVYLKRYLARPGRAATTPAIDPAVRARIEREIESRRS